MKNPVKSAFSAPWGAASKALRRTSLRVAGVAIALASSCTTIAVDDWLLTDANSDNVSVSAPYWSAVIVDEAKPEENSSDGYFVMESTSGKPLSKVWLAKSFDLKKGKAEENLWVRFRSLDKDLVLIQGTSYEENERNIEVYPIRKMGDKEYRLYAFENEEAKEWVKGQDLSSELGNHLTTSEYTIRFDAYAVENYRDQIIELLKEMEASGNFKEGVYIEFKGFQNLEDLKEYVATRVK